MGAAKTYLQLTFALCNCYNRKPAVVIKHTGLDESGDSNASEDVDFTLNANGHLDITRLPKGRSSAFSLIL